MANQVCIYFQVHQPNRLKHYSFFEIGRDHFYEDDALNREVLYKVAEKCYLPANQMLYDAIIRHKGKLKVTYSLSGVFMEQCEHFHPRVLGSFRRLADTGCVEFLAETYYHSLAYVFSPEEFEAQVKKHEEKIYQLFDVKPKVLRNTELVYNNSLALFAEKMGYKGILTEGTDRHLKGRHPNQVFKPSGAENIKVLLKNYKLSDDVAFRFGNTQWTEYPLTPEKYSSWIKEERGECVNLFMDYETIGEHHWHGTGIFDFWNNFFDHFIAQDGAFKTCSEALGRKKAIQTYDVNKAFISWADTERDLSAWQQNNMQIEALDKVYGLEKYLKLCDDKDLWHIWRKLQTSDHFYYMSTKHANDGAVHQYFSPYSSPYDAYIYFMNALTDLEVSLEKKGVEVINW